MILTLTKHQLVFIGPWAGGVHEAHRVGRGGSHLSFHMRAPIEERIPLLRHSGSLGGEGAPRVSFTRGSLCRAVTIDAVADKNWEQRDQKHPHANSASGAPNSSSYYSEFELSAL
jgi:hypothetical protein